MLLLITIGLVVVALVLLIVGFIQHTLTLIYLSIACSAVAALTLIVYSRLQKRRSLRLGGAVVTADLADEPVAAFSMAGEVQDRSSETAPMPVSSPATREMPSSDWAPTPPPPPTPAAVAAVGNDQEPWDQDEEVWDDGENVFPIEDYDDLRVAEILPLLGELDPEELEDVRAREADGKARGTLLRRIDSMLAEASTGAAVAEPVQPDRQPSYAPPSPVAAGPAASAPWAGEELPIAEYDELRAGEILPLLAELDPDELVTVAEHERAGARRSTILFRISRLIEAAGGVATDTDQVATGADSAPPAAAAPSVSPSAAVPPPSPELVIGSAPGARPPRASKAAASKAAASKAAAGSAAPAPARGRSKKAAAEVTAPVADKAASAPSPSRSRRKAAAELPTAQPTRVAAGAPAATTPAPKKAAAQPSAPATKKAAAAPAGTPTRRKALGPPAKRGSAPATKAAAPGGRNVRRAAGEPADKAPAPAKSAATKSAPAKSAATKSAPAKRAATKSAATKSAATKSAATKSAATKSAARTTKRSR